MSRLTQDEFVSKASKIHNGKYGYKHAIYRGSKYPIDIDCPIHGLFTQTANTHLQGKGCWMCDNEARRKPLYGVGINDLPFPSNQDVAYNPWRNMLQRCFYEKYHEAEPTYKGCAVCDEWLVASNFKKWMIDPATGYQEGYQLDKDILVKGNKLYSPDTCCFVPKEINYILLNRKLHRGNMPIGVYKRGNSHIAYYNNMGKRIILGSFNTPEAAFLAYKKAKEQYVKELAEKYYKEGKITERVHNALLNYRVEITD